MFGRTMQQYYNTCSFGKATFTEPDNVVAGTITLPCNGTGPLGPWDARLCRNQVRERDKPPPSLGPQSEPAPPAIPGSRSASLPTLSPAPAPQELYAWMQMAMSQTASSGTVDPLLLKRGGLRWNFILPSLPACDFSGKGAVGCGRFCPNFINGEAGADITGATGRL